MAKARSTIVTRFRQTPLSVRLNLEPVGEIPAIQNHDPVLGYVPDYTVSPLVIRPRLSVSDPDGWQTSEDAPIEAGYKWEMQDETGVWKTLSADTTAATGIHMTGTAPWPTAQVSVQSNTPTGKARALRLTCRYLDTRSGGVYTVSQTIGLQCSSEAAPAPVLTLSTGRTVMHNPFADEEVTRVVPSLTALGQVCAASDYGTDWGVEWQTLDDSGVWRDYDPDDPRMVFMAPDGAALVLRRGLCADGTTVRARGWYTGADGRVYGAADPSGGTFTPEAVVTVRRDLSAMGVDIQECAREVSRTAREVTALAVVSDGSRGIAASPLRHVRLEWDTSAGPVTDRERVTVPLSAAGATINVEATDRGADRVVMAGTKAVTVGGAILTTPNP